MAPQNIPSKEASYDDGDDDSVVAPDVDITTTMEWMYLADDSMADPVSLSISHNLMNLARLSQLNTRLLLQILEQLRIYNSDEHGSVSADLSSSGSDDGNKQTDDFDDVKEGHSQ